MCKQQTAYEMRSSDWSSDVCSSDLFEQFIAHQRQVVRRAAGGALLRHDDAQALARHAGGGLGLALQEIENTHRDQPPNTRWRKPFLGTSMKRSGRSSPRMRATVSP